MRRPARLLFLVLACFAAPASPPPGQADLPGVPRISFERTTVDLGTVTDVGVYSASFPFTNAGTGALVIEKVKPGCKCAVPSLERTEYGPGESGQIDVVYKPQGQEGYKPRVMHVLSNDPENPSQAITLASVVEPLLGFDSRRIQLGTLPPGREHVVAFAMHSRTPDLRVLNARARNEELSLRIARRGEPDADGRFPLTGEVVVAADAPWGVYRGLTSARGWIQVSGTPIGGDRPARAIYRLTFEGELFHELEPVVLTGLGKGLPGSMLAVGRVERGAAFEQRLRLTRTSGAGFEVLAATLEGERPPDTKVELERTAPDRVVVKLSGSGADFRGRFEGSILLTTDVPGEEHLRIRFQGNVP